MEFLRYARAAVQPISMQLRTHTQPRRRLNKRLATAAVRLSVSLLLHNFYAYISFICTYIIAKINVALQLTKLRLKKVTTCTTDTATPV